MIRKRILLASLLKPVTDTRLYEKLGQSLAKLPELEVHVAGFWAPLPPADKNPTVSFHPIFLFPRLSWGRIKAQKAYWNLLRRVQPQVIIVGTHELLLTSWLYTQGRPVKLVYDVQENYYLNVTTQSIYRKGLRHLLGFSIRSMESLISRAVDHFFLAEASYAEELPFLRNNYTILQNKYAGPAHSLGKQRTFPLQLGIKAPLRLLYSGTISKVYGVLEAIEFTQQLKQWVPSAELTIVGYCADAEFLIELKSILKPLPFITLVGGEALVPHQQILAYQQSHHVGLLPYRPHPSTQNCMPTKLFEYQANGLVTITQQNPHWEEMLLQNNAGFAHDFQQLLSEPVVTKLLKNPFYQGGIPTQVFWAEEETQVQQEILRLVTQK